MDGKRNYREKEAERNTQAGLGLLSLDAIMLFFIGYYFLSWPGLILAIPIIWLAYKSPKFLILMMFVASFFWGLCFWKLMLFINTEVLSFLLDPPYANFGAIVCGIIAGLVTLNLHRLAYERIEEGRSGSAHGLLPNVNQSEPANPAPDKSREDYSEYRREGYIIRDYRIGRDRTPPGEEDR